MKRSATPSPPEACADALADRLQGLEAVATLGRMQPDALGRTMIDGHEHAGRPLAHGHLIRRPLFRRPPVLRTLMSISLYYRGIRVPPPTPPARRSRTSYDISLWYPCGALSCG
jgi:hypothetical protein